MNPVLAQLETLTIPTYGLGRPEKNPVFFEKRVYQGSCGKVYPVPFIDKVCQDSLPTAVEYQAARLENEYVRLVMLPEIGGRIFMGQNKADRNYELTVFKALALRELGRKEEAQLVLEAMIAFAKAEMEIPDKIDYFATSLPNLLVFDEDLEATKEKQMTELLDLATAAMA